MKVTHKIVEKQIDFFDKGINFLHSMSLSEIANEANLSISTISRITTNKYLSTPIGVFELKYFFSSSMPNSEGNNNSNKQLKHMIKLIIENEKSGNVYSDLDIVNLLKNKGFVIARRTVTKYREKMNIPPSSVRKNKMRLEETS
jgi:RNA polymerase sigma-54 factor